MCVSGGVCLPLRTSVSLSDFDCLTGGGGGGGAEALQQIKPRAGVLGVEVVTGGFVRRENIHQHGQTHTHTHTFHSGMLEMHTHTTCD